MKSIQGCINILVSNKKECLEVLDYVKETYGLEWQHLQESRFVPVTPYPFLLTYTNTLGYSTIQDWHCYWTPVDGSLDLERGCAAEYYFVLEVDFNKGIAECEKVRLAFNHCGVYSFGLTEAIEQIRKEINE